MAKLIKVAQAQELPPGKAAAFDVEGKRIAIFNVDGSYYALDDTCTHDGGPLCEGEVREGKVTCPWHAAEFDLKSGEALCPPAFEGVRCYKVQVEGNDVKVEID